MKIVQAALIAAAMLVFIPADASAQGASETTTTVKSAAETTGPKTGNLTSKKRGGKATGDKAELKEAGNKNCPITGAPVGSMQAGSHVVYNGYKIGLCCDGCKGKFNEDPEKYLKAALAK